MAPIPDLRERLLKKLQERGAKPQCEVCGQNNWAVLEQPVGLPITDLSGSIVIPQPQIPTALLVCNNCANIRFFALGALGLLPEQNKGGEKP